MGDEETWDWWCTWHLPWAQLGQLPFSWLTLKVTFLFVRGYAYLSNHIIVSFLLLFSLQKIIGCFSVELYTLYVVLKVVKKSEVIYLALIFLHLKTGCSISTVLKKQGSLPYIDKLRNANFGVLNVSKSECFLVLCCLCR